jgi:hypothetical protein
VNLYWVAFCVVALTFTVCLGVLVGYRIRLTENQKSWLLVVTMTTGFLVVFSIFVAVCFQFIFDDWFT